VHRRPIRERVAAFLKREYPESESDQDNRGTRRFCGVESGRPLAPLDDLPEDAMAQEVVPTTGGHGRGDLVHLVTCGYSWQT